MIKFLYRLIFASLILATTIIPLLFTAVNEELFEFIKMLAIYLLAITVTSSYLIIRVAQKRWRWHRTPLDLTIILFLLAQILSTIFSIHPTTSFFGYYTRFHGGLLSTLAYIAIFYVLINYLRDLPYQKALKSIKYLLFSVMFGALLVGLYAIPEHFGHSASCLIVQGSFDVSCWVQDVKNRVFATIGQPNWLAAFMIMVLPLAIVGLLTSQSSKSKSRHYLIKLGWLSLILVYYLTLIFTKSRSGWLGLVVGLAIFGGGWLLAKWTVSKNQSNSNQSKNAHHNLLSTSLIGSSIIIVGLTGLLIVVSAIFGTPLSPPLLGKSQPVNTTILTPTGTSLDSGGTESGEIRKIVWQGAVKVWQRYPILGSGLETFAYSYYQDRPLAHNLVSEWNFLYNKAHNEFLNYLATTGLVGLLTYLLLLSWGCWLGIKLFWQRITSITLNWSVPQKAGFQGPIGNNQESAFDSEMLYPVQYDVKSNNYFVLSPLLPLALVSSIIALSVSNFFGFSTVMVTLLLYMFMAIVSVLTIFENQLTISADNDQIDLNSPSLTKNQRRRLEKQLARQNATSVKQSVRLNNQTSPRPAHASLPASFSSWWQYAITSLICIIALALIWNTFNWWLADMTFARGKALIRSNQWQDGLASLISASARSPKEALYTDTLSEQYAQLALKLVEVNEATLSADFIQAAQQASDVTLKLNPVHLNFWKTRVRVYSQLSVLEPQYLTQTKAALEAALKLAPTDPALVFNQGKIAVFEQKWVDAEKYFLQSIEMKPNLVDARMALAQLYEQLNRPIDASQQYQYLLDNVNPDDEMLQNKVAELATASGQKR